MTAITPNLCRSMSDKMLEFCMAITELGQLANASKIGEYAGYIFRTRDKNTLPVMYTDIRTLMMCLEQEKLMNLDWQILTAEVIRRAMVSIEAFPVWDEVTA